LAHGAQVVAIGVTQAEYRAPGAEHLLPIMRKRMRRGGGVDRDGLGWRLGRQRQRRECNKNESEESNVHDRAGNAGCSWQDYGHCGLFLKGRSRTRAERPGAATAASRQSEGIPAPRGCLFSREVLFDMLSVQHAPAIPLEYLGDFM